MRLWRNLWRRKVRSALTIAGITIGIWALVVFTSMANKINGLVGGARTYFGDKIIVNAGASDRRTDLPTRRNLEDRLATLEGVAAVVPQVQFSFGDRGLRSFSPPELVLGMVAAADRGRDHFRISYARGRALTPQDEGSDVVVLGADLARRHGATPDSMVPIRGRSFRVVGILEPTLTLADTTAIVPLRAGQELYWQGLPAIVRDQIEPTQLVSRLAVYPADGVSSAALAERIRRDLGLEALTTEEFDEQVGSSVVILNAIIVGVALISLVVGGLSVINTMAMAVAERTREIGIRRAIGATRGRIMREFVVEAGLIGFLGGVIGLALGCAVVYGANEWGRPSGTVLFDLTSSTALFAVAFSIALGMVAGVAPAWNAARLDPVEALRYE